MKTRSISAPFAPHDHGQAFYHFSVDDVFDAVQEVSERDLPLSRQPLFSFLDSLHQDYDAQIDLYLFAEHNDAHRRVSLADLSDARRDEYQAREWMRFGPHALNYATPPHAQTVTDQIATFRRIDQAIDRFAGSAARSAWVRLHYFSECYEAADCLRGLGVRALLTSDKPAVCYRLPAANKQILAARGRVAYGGLEFIRSHFRFEHLWAEGYSVAALQARIDRILEQHGFLVMFTHEIDVAEPGVRRLIKAAMAYLARLGIPSR